MFFFYWLSLFLFVGSVEAHQDENPIVILISFDGFRWDYLYKTKTPTLAWLAKNGVSATIINNFVTRTFPNHYSIVTGMYEERHGLIDNYMYDPVYNDSFNPKTTDPKWFNASEPIWITNEKQGGGRLSAVINWVGSATPIQGRRANFSMPYNKSIPYKRRVDMILEQLDKEHPANFLAVYFEEPDAAGHRYGPNSKQVIQAIQKVDNITNYLVQGLQKRNLFDKVNIILTSDHGMSDVNSSRFIFLDQYISSDKYTLVHCDVNAYIIPNKGEKHNIYRNLSQVPHITVFYKEDIPDYWHYRHNRRITPIFVTCDIGYKIFHTSNQSSYKLGEHGYNNSSPEMNPFFIAHGPAFKQSYCSTPFSIVHIYALMCHIMGVTPAPNDGNVAAVSHILRPSAISYVLLFILITISLAVLLLMLNGIVRNLRRPVYNHFYRLQQEDI